MAQQQYTVRDNETGKMVTFAWHSPDQPTDRDLDDIFAEARTGESGSGAFDPGIPEMKPVPSHEPTQPTGPAPGTVDALIYTLPPEMRPGADLILGALRGAGQTATNVARLHGMASPLAAIPGPVLDTIEEKLQTTNPTQKVGQFAERVGEFMIPFGTGARAASLLPKGPGIVRGAARLAARSAGEAAEMGGKAFAQTGDPEDAIGAALFGGALPPVAAAAKGAGNVLFSALPERLYGQVFKLAEKDLSAAYRASAKGGPVNPTTAREVMERGVMGSSRNMAVWAIKKLDNYEGQLQIALKGRHVKLPQKKDYLDLLDTVASEFGGAFSETGKQAAALATRIRSGIRGPFVSAKDALTLKRLLDRSRSASSFRESPRLSAKQDEFKRAADLVRGVLHDTFPSASKLLNEERVVIQAFDAIVKDAVQRNNRRLLGLTDYILGGGGMASGFGVAGFGAAAAVRGFQNPFTLTGLGQGLYRTGQRVPSAGVVTRAGASAGAVAARPSTRDRQEGRE